VVKAGSHTVAELVLSMQQYVRGMHELRQELVGDGMLAAEAGGCHFSRNCRRRSSRRAFSNVLQM
jgi:hypothetical protein